MKRSMFDLIDFSLLLVILTLVCGVIWAVDRLVLLPRRKARATGVIDEEESRHILQESKLVEYARSFFPIFLIVLLLRSFLVEPFRIPSNSMMPTLLTGDFILVNKFTYGLRLPVLRSKILDLGAPERGDVVVFRSPEQPDVDFIKRVVGVPGDRVQYQNKTLSINGKVMTQEEVGIYRGVGSGVSMTGTVHLSENLDKTDHSILVDTRKRSQAVDMVIPEGQYFVMGDNRDNSNDSRFWGTVPDENLVGRAFMIWMYYDSQADGTDWKRIGSSIQ